MRKQDFFFSVKKGIALSLNNYRELTQPYFLTLLLFLSPLLLAKYSGGTGGSNDPYQIANANDMNEIGTHSEDWGSHFLLINDINLADYTGTEFNIIGNWNNPFTGVFDGNGNSIYNFTYVSTGIDAIGLFGRVGIGAEIKNLGLINPSINAGTRDSIGCLAGLLNVGTILGCWVENADVSGDDNVGILVGWNSGTIVNCRVNGVVSGDDRIGGLVGQNWSGSILNCHAKTSASGRRYIAGLVGHIHEGTIENCSAVGDVNGSDYAMGGLVGENWGVIHKCYAKEITTGYFATGGLVGSNFGSVHNCYSAGSVEGTFDSEGGLVGKNENFISNCFSAAKVSGSGRVGGFVGWNYFGSYSNCFWDNTVNSGISGIGDGTIDPDIIAESTSKMQAESTFTSVGWDFVEIWDVGENQTYPYLRIYPAGDMNHDSQVNFSDFAILADHWLQDNNP